MGFGPGGVAAKLGDRFEAWWVIEQLLRLLHERLSSVTVEGIGDDEHGVDLWVVTKDGTREAHQCKARCGAAEKWTVTALASRGVISYLREQLGRDPRAVFRLVSGIPFTALSDLCEALDGSGGNAVAFLESQTPSSSRGRLFRECCRHMGMDPDMPADRARAADLLRRTRVVCRSVDTATWREDLVSRASLLVRGESQHAISVMRELAESGLHRSWTTDGLWATLEQQGVHPRRLDRDDRLRPCIHELLLLHQEQVASRLIGRALLERPEVGKVLDMADERAVVVVHGAAGSGKTGILYGVVEQASRQGRLVLPVSLSRHVPGGSTQCFGADLGLPDSPVWCLASLAAAQPALLVLDQLDSLRLAGNHGYQALEVVRSLAREVKAVRAEGGRLSLVVACRSFDLEHDPEIRSWLRSPEDGTRGQVQVGGLSDGLVGRVTERHGVRFRDLSPEQRRVLSNAQNLYLWTQVAQCRAPSSFMTTTQLMERYWEWVGNQVSASRMDAGRVGLSIAPLATAMVKANQDWVPARLLEDAGIRDVLLSCGVTVITDGGARLRFAHQSYLDYWVARDGLRQMALSGGTLVDWLGPREEQTLLRHQQFRYALTMLADEVPARVASLTRAMLSAETVRIHYKVLALQVMGSLPAPPAQVLALASELLGHQTWREHALTTIYAAHPPFLKDLAARDTLAQWLRGADEARQNEALWLMRTGMDSCGDLFVSALERLVTECPAQAQRVHDHLYIDPAECADTVFGLLLCLVGRGVKPHYVDWPKLLARDPARVIRLVEAIAASWPAEPDEPQNGLHHDQESRFRWCEHQDDVDAAATQAICDAAARVAEAAWRGLVPHVLRCVGHVLGDQWTLGEWLGSGRTGFHLLGHEPQRVLVLAVVSAGRALAAGSPETLWAGTEALRASPCRVVQQILVEAYSVLPPRLADPALSWLCTDPELLSTGGGHEEPRWLPARRMVEALSPHCSAEALARLEGVLLGYHEPREREDARRCLGFRRDGYVHHYHGMLQYFLLPALDPRRRSARCTDEIGVLQRKFAGTPPERFLSGGPMSGGTIVSPVDARKHRLSDAQWLEIVVNPRIPSARRARPWKQIGPDLATESSVEHFARSLAEAAQCEPQRFACLALRFPDGVDERYVEAILRALSGGRPPDGSPEDLKSAWAPAEGDTVQAVLRKYSVCAGSDAAQGWCSLIERRPGIQWSEDILARLAWLAGHHPDPEPGRLRVHSKEVASEASVAVLESNTFNGVRSIATRAMGAVLFAQPDRLPSLERPVCCALADPRPAVRMAAVEPLLAMLSMGGEVGSRAIGLFIQVAQADLRIAAYGRSSYFFNHGRDRFPELDKLLLDMANSSAADVAESGSNGVATYWIFYEAFGDRIAGLVRGTKPQRLGACKAAVQHHGAPEAGDRARALILRLMDDPDEEVCRHVSCAFGGKRPTAGLEDREFCQAYTNSAAFRLDPSHLVRAIEEQADLLACAPLLVAVCRAFSGELADQSRTVASHLGGTAGRLAPLLRRLYEQAAEVQERDVVLACLDEIDRLVAARVGWRDVLTAMTE